jgi:hypothetical protein
MWPGCICWPNISLADLLDRQHVVPKYPHSFDDWQREVLVGIEPVHQSASFSSICREISSPCDRT